MSDQHSSFGKETAAEYSQARNVLVSQGNYFRDAVRGGEAGQGSVLRLFHPEVLPDPQLLLEALARYQNHELFESFRANLKEYLADVSSPGYKVLRPFVRRWFEEKKINQKIREIFAPLLL